MISSRQLEYFQAVARELHFTRAAEALRIAQPALSQQIRKLERQLGLDLFERNNHKVSLTPAGAALLKHTERILSDLVAVEQEMLGWAGGVRGRIRLGLARGLTARLARVFAAFSSTYPAVEVELQEQNTSEMLTGLQAGRLDVVTLAAPPPPGDRSLLSHSLGAEPLVLVTGVDTALARQTRLRLAELDGVDLIKYPPGSAVGEIIAGALAAAGAQPRVRFETRDYSTARTLVNVGLAAAIMPRSVARADGPRVHVVELSPEPVWTPALAWSAHRRPTPALATLIDFMVGHPALAVSGDISEV
ncbi:LysR family transcriptional regulator [Kutzneria sp. CA-103260]|uniref:LysR family transcriptional regulator n=1 Tax=Kutzneria sp. CA-103260 TaxID=2802641 RepID=UPI001BA43C61|nr:LysR family transcriptional regulator [Kutzneria sp. CA-103260]QUQ66038.1 LysR family transcriptional regulator [Kutzneria sp. CA-103260]